MWVCTCERMYVYSSFVYICGMCMLFFMVRLNLLLWLNCKCMILGIHTYMCTFVCCSYVRKYVCPLLCICCIDACAYLRTCVLYLCTYVQYVHTCVYTVRIGSHVCTYVRIHTYVHIYSRYIPMWVCIFSAQITCGSIHSHSWLISPICVTNWYCLLQPFANILLGKLMNGTVKPL